ncbi:hypothetical protein ACT7BH_004317, partial [Cronobacter turicensis]
RKYGLFCFYIAPGKRQVRSAYLPYKTFRRVGKRKRTHPSPKNGRCAPLTGPTLSAWNVL